MVARDRFCPGFFPDKFSVFQRPPRVIEIEVLRITGQSKVSLKLYSPITKINKIAGYSRETGNGGVVVLCGLYYLTPIAN